MKSVFLLIICAVGALGLSINFDSNVKGLEVKVNKVKNGTSSETNDGSDEIDDKDLGAPTLQKFFEYLGPVKTIPQIVDETVERFQTIYRSPKDQLKSLEEVENIDEPNVLASDNDIQRRKRSIDTISGRRLNPYRQITKRAGEDAPCISNPDLQGHKLGENEEINAIKEEMQKLKDLIVILRDQQHVVDILNGFQHQKNDLNPNPHAEQNNNNNENAKLLKLMESLITQINSQSANAQKPTTINGKTESSISLPIQRSDNFRQILTTIGTTTTLRPTTIQAETEEPPKNSMEEVTELIGKLRSIEERLSRLVQLKQRMAETKEANEEEVREAEGRSLTVPNNDTKTEITTLPPANNNNHPINNTIIDDSTNNNITANNIVEDSENSSEEVQKNKDAAILLRIEEIKNILNKLTDSQLKLQHNSQSEFVGNMENWLARKSNDENSTTENSLKLEQLAKTLQLLRYLQDISTLQTELEKNPDHKELQLQSDQPTSEGPTNFEVQLNNLSKVVKSSNNEAQNPIEEIRKSNDDRTRNASDKIEDVPTMIETNDAKMRDVDNEEGDGDGELATEVINQALENLEEVEGGEEEEAPEEAKPPPFRSYGPQYDKEEEGAEISSSEHTYSDYGGKYNGRPPIPQKPTPYYTKPLDPDYLKHICKNLHPYYPPSPPPPPPSPPQYMNQNNYRPYRPRPIIETPYMEKPYKEDRPSPSMYSYPGPYKNPEMIPPPKPMYRPQYPHREEYGPPRDMPYRPPFLDSSPGKRPIPYGRSSSSNEELEQGPLEGDSQEQQRNPFRNPTVQAAPTSNVEDLKMKLRSLESRVAELGHVPDSNEEQQRHVENLQRLISNLKFEIREATDRENRNNVQQSLNFIRRNKREIREDDVNVERQAGELVDKFYNMLEGSRLAYDDDIDNDAILQQLPRASMERSIEMEQRQLESQIEQLKKQIDSSPIDEGNISKIPLQPSSGDSNTAPPVPSEARTSTNDEESDKARTLSHHHTVATGPSRYYGQSDNYGHGYGVQKHYGHKKADILGSIIEKIFDKLQHAIPAIIKGLVGDFVDGAFYDHGYAGYGSGHGYDSGYGYGADKYDYGHDISYKFKSFGLLGTLPLALLNILSTVSYFFKLLQKNKFIRNFLVPVGVIIAVTGLVAFLVFWFNYDAFAGSMYGGYGDYHKVGYDGYQKGGYDGYQKGGYGSYQKGGYEDHHKGGGYESYQKPGYKGVSYSSGYSYKKPYYRESNMQSFTPPFTQSLEKPGLNQEPSFPGIVTQINDHTKPKM